MNLSVLQNFNGKINEFPFPYIVIDNALPEDLYRKLEDNYPTIEKIAGEKPSSNTRYDLSAKASLVDNSIPAVWRDFVGYHASQHFYSQAMSIFGRYCPEYVHKSTCVRNNGDKIQLDCQIGINSPVSSVSTVKGPHVDNRVEIYAGLLYMRKNGDVSTGGNLNIYHPLKSFDPINKKEYPEKLFEIVDTVKYTRNKLVMFLCSPKSFHGVTSRSVTKHERRLINIIAEVPNGKFW